MPGSYDRRRFLQQAAGAAVVLQMPEALLRSADTDIQAQVDPLLRLQPTTLPDAQNAWPLLKQACDRVSELPEGEFELEDCFSDDKPDAQRDSLISAWLDDHQGAIPLVQAANARGQLEFPRGPWDDPALDRMSELVRLNRYMSLRFQRLLSQGKSREAAATSCLWADTSRLLKGGGGYLVDYLVAVACEHAALNRMQRIARSPRSDDETVRLMLAHLKDGDGAVEGMRRSLVSEYQQFLLPLLVKADGLDTAEALAIFYPWSEGSEIFLPRKTYEARRDKIVQLLEGHPKPYDLADSVKRSSARAAQQVRDLELSWPAYQAKPDDTANDKLPAWPRHLNLDLLIRVAEADGDELPSDAEMAAARKKLKNVVNPLGRKVLETITPGIGSAMRSNQGRYQGTRLFLAICLFARQQKVLPKSLDELVEAKFLDKLPLDPFSAESFQYSREQKALWSVGADGQVSPEQKFEEWDFEPNLWRLEGVVIAGGSSIDA